MIEIFDIYIYKNILFNLYNGYGEMVDALDLGSSTYKYEGSIPSIHKKKNIQVYDIYIF